MQNGDLIMNTKQRFLGVAALVVAASVAPTVWAFRAPEREPTPNMDRRLAGKAAGQVAAEKAPALAELQARLPGVRVLWNSRFSAPEHVAARDSFLTGPNAEGLGAAPEAAQAVPAGDPHRAVKVFLKTHAGLFGYGPEVLATAIVKHDYTLAHNGLRAIHWQQHLQGVPIFEGIMVGHVTRQGELVSLSTRLVPHLAQAKAAGLNHLGGGAAHPPITAAQAVLLAAADLGEKNLTEKHLEAETQPAGAEAQQRFHAVLGLQGQVDVRLTWLALDDANLRLCWQVILTSASRGEMVQTLVDAQTGEVLLRNNLTRHISNASFNVWTNDSPAPMTPGLPVPGTNQAPVVNRSFLTLAALNTNASPAGWVDDGTNALVGNNCMGTFALGANLYLPVGNPARVFDQPCDLTQPAASYVVFSSIQSFFLMNFMHDTLYQLGFDEASGNFQNNNFGRGGVGGDPVLAIAQDPGNVNNAFMATPPVDGMQPIMDSGVANFPSQVPGRDFALNADVMLHEYTHGLTERVLGKGVALPYLGQVGAMNEGTSDFFALSVLSQEGDDPSGTYPTGGYLLYLASFVPGGRPFTNNYYFGIRRYPYCTNLLKDPLTYKDIDPAQADPHSAVPYTTVDFLQPPTPAYEVHNAGEVWATTLWEMRVKLVAKHGFTLGNPMTLRLVIDAMRVAPVAPNFLQMRDAILLADRLDNNGTNYLEIWSAFAKRGMGGAATSPDGTTCFGVVEAYDLPSLDYVGCQVDDSITGNNNGLIDVNECFGLKVAFRNDSIVSITNITATVASLTPGVFVVDGASPYPDLAPGAVAYNLLPFRLYTTPDFACGTPVRLQLSHSSSLDTNVTSFVLSSGAISAAPYRFNNNSSLFIPDNNTNGVDSFLPVTGMDGRIGKVTVSLYLAHSNVSQLKLQLIAPDGTAVTLAAGKGGPGLGFGTNCATSARTTFDDSALASIQSALPPFVGQFAPQSPLAAFNGKSSALANGAWRLHIADQASGLAGILQCWSLALYPVLCVEGGGACAPDVQVVAVDKPDPAFVGHDLTYSISVTNLRSVPAYGVFLTNLLPDSVSLLRVTNLTAAWTNATFGTNVFTNLNGTLVFNVGTLSNQANFSFDLVVQPQTTGWWTNVCSAGGTNGDMNLTNNFVPVATFVTNAVPLIVPAGVQLVSDPNGSGGIENSETVSVSFGLANVGSAATTNLTATLRALNGITLPSPSGPVVYGVLANEGAAVSNLFTFTAFGLPGTVIRAVFDLKDQGSLGTVEFDFTLGGSATFQNQSQITINDFATANPYPSSITVSGLVGQVSHVTATLNSFQHIIPQDVNVLLVGPGGQNAVLMAHAGTNVSVSGLTLTFDSAAAAPALPQGARLTSGTFSPTLYGVAASFPAPAVPSPYGNSLDAFKTAAPNGSWSLYVLDDTKGADGKIVGGWSLSVDTVVPVNPTADLALSIATSASTVVPGAAVTYVLTVTNFGPGAATGVIVSNLLPAGVTFPSALVSQGSLLMSGNGFLANLGTLPARAAATVTLTVTAPQTAGAFVNRATVTNANEQDFYLGDNTSAATVTVVIAKATADLAVASTYVPVLGGTLTNATFAGSNVVFTTTVSNLGPAGVYEVWVTNVLAPTNALTVVSVTNSMGGGGSTLGTNGSVVVASPLGYLASGSNAVVTVVVQSPAPPSSTNAVSYSNLVSVGSAYVNDSNLANNQTNLSLRSVAPAPQLVLVGVVLTNNVNNSIDPGQTVTGFFVLRNDGQVAAQNVVATLVSNQVVRPVGVSTMSYGTLYPNGASVTRPFTFSNTLGGAASPAQLLAVILNLQATAMTNASVTNVLLTTASYANTDYLAIPSQSTALPYPAVLTVTNPGVAGANLISKVTVTLNHLTHDWLHDLNVLLVGPAGQSVLLLSHAGSGGSANDATLVFTDTGSRMPASLSKVLTNGTYLPTAYGTPLDLPAPAPAGPYSAYLSAFAGTDPTGTWSLYILDDGGTDGGSLGGWSLSFSYAMPLPPLADLALGATSSMTPTNVPGSLQTLTLTVNNLGPTPATGVTLADGLPSGFTLLSNSLAAQVAVAADGASLNWQVGSLGVGANSSLKLYGISQASGTFANTASVQANEADPAPGNNTNVLTFVVQAPPRGDLVAAGSIWNFLDNGTTNLDNVAGGATNAWTTAGFDDSAWHTGPARLGYGHGDERTALSYGNDPNNRFITTYFRQEFMVSTPAYTNLTLRLLGVQGAAVYLNGHEVFRQNLPDGALNHATLALAEMPTNAQALFFATNVSPSAVVAGANVLAVELHQNAPNGYTVGFDLELLANAGFSNLPPQVTLHSPTNQAVLTPEQIFFNATASDPDGVVTRVEYLATNVSTGAAFLIGGTNQAPYELVWTNAPAGTYQIVARAWDNSGGAGLSQVIQVVVVEPPAVLIDHGSVWKYVDNGLEQGRVWTLLGFDDSYWPSGQTSIGFGNYPVTQVNPGPATNRFTTYYFRKSFAAPTATTNLFFELRSVHGAVVYLNGVELFRNNMPTGAVSYATLALTNTPPLELGKFTPFVVQGTNLLPGLNNQLAVEVHQWSITSTNLAFDLRLSTFPSPALHIARSNQTAIIAWPPVAANYVVETSRAFSRTNTWTLLSAPIRSMTNGWFYVTNTISTNQLYYRLRRQ